MSPGAMASFRAAIVGYSDDIESEPICGGELIVPRVTRARRCVIKRRVPACLLRRRMLLVAAGLGPSALFARGSRLRASSTVAKTRQPRSRRTRSSPWMLPAHHPLSACAMRVADRPGVAGSGST
jgi:hypothetical protein